MGCHFLLQGIFPTQESNPGLLHCRQILYQLSYKHCRGHKKGSLISAYNCPADQKAKEIALTSPDPPTTREILSYLHSLFHPTSKTLQQFLHNHFPITSADQQYLDNLTHSCQTCQRTNPNANLKLTSFPTHQMRGSLPARDRQIDFTHMPPRLESQIPPGPRGHLFGMGRNISHYRQKSPHRGPNPPHRNYPQVWPAFIPTA